MGERIELGAGTKGRLRDVGSHSAYFDAQNRLVVEWYDFGDDAPCESANMILFDAEAQRRLRALLEAGDPDPRDLRHLLGHRFSSWFEVNEFALQHGVEFTSEVDFLP